MSHMSNAAPYDLQDFLSKTRTGFYGPLVESENRHESKLEVDVIENDISKPTADPLNAYAFVDGIQSQMLVTYRDHRPIVLAYTAAGAANRGPALQAVNEKLHIVCSEKDEEWLDHLNNADNPIPVATVVDGPPPMLEKLILERVGNIRATCETELVSTLATQVPANAYLVLDGSLLGKEHSAKLVGVVKSSRTKYLKDETQLYSLPTGWRSAMFAIPTPNSETIRYSAYLRLVPANHNSWSFGLIRLETFDPNLIDALAARALIERQTAASGDGRWDRHLVSVATCEKLLRARKPAAFTIG